MEGLAGLTDEELKAFTRRALIELKGEDGEFEFSYLSFFLAFFCDKGVAKKVKISFNGRTIYKKLN